MIVLYPHQKKFIEDNPNKAILSFGTRVGKSLAIIGWLKNYPTTRFMLVCPKRIKGQWKQLLAENGVAHATVLTKEEIKKADLSNFTGMIFDEAHWAGSPLFFKPSQLTRTIYEWVRNNHDAPVIMATATPIASSPANLHTLLALTGRYIDWKEYRSKYYDLVRRPWNPRPYYEPKKNWREEVYKLAQKYCWFKKLSDIVEVPEQRHHVIPVKLTPQTLKDIKDYADVSSSKEWYGKHKLAQYSEKLAVIRELSVDEPKVIVVVKYTDQVAYYAKELANDREVVVLTGQTKDQGEAIRRAQEMPEGYFVVQADCGEGFRGDDFSMMIFASMSWKFVSYEQCIGRMLHLEKKRSNDYYYLLADEKDRDIYHRVVMETKDFNI